MKHFRKTVGKFFFSEITSAKIPPTVFLKILSIKIPKSYSFFMSKRFRKVRRISKPNLEPPEPLFWPQKPNLEPTEPQKTKRTSEPKPGSTQH